MAIQSERMTVSDLTKTLADISGAEDLPVRIADYDGHTGMQVYSVRKHVITDEEGAVTDAYVVING